MEMLQMLVPRPSFLREQVLLSPASSCTMTRAPSGILSRVCRLHLTPVARAVAIESRAILLYFLEYRSRITTACPRHLEALETGTILGGCFTQVMLGARRGCPDFSCRTAGAEDAAPVDTEHNTPDSYTMSSSTTLFRLHSLSEFVQLQWISI